MAGWWYRAAGVLGTLVAANLAVAVASNPLVQAGSSNIVGSTICAPRHRCSGNRRRRRLAWRTYDRTSPPVQSAFPDRVVRDGIRHRIVGEMAIRNRDQFVVERLHFRHPELDLPDDAGITVPLDPIADRTPAA